MKAYIIILIAIAIVLLGLSFIKFSGEDSWIKDERGVWIKHGNPKETPDYVIEQQEAISEAENLYLQKKDEGLQFLSQCLGVVNEYAVDIISVPRTEEDNLPENQCQEYREGKVSNFIELDKEGNIVRVV